MSQKFQQLSPLYEEYYKSSYPYQQIVDWLSYHGTVDAPRREWSYECMLDSGETFIKRWVQVSCADDLRKLTAPVFGETKLKFDIGPVYTLPMDQRRSSVMVPQWREFVFDIDADDFKTVRKCCSDKKMCNRCWRFMECAACVLIHFCQTYGFNDYFFAFSGRRGMHCWVCDPDARFLSQQLRVQMLSVFELIKIDNESIIEITFQEASRTHEYLFLICEKFYLEMFQEQGWLNAGEGGHFDETVSALRKIVTNKSAKVNTNNFKPQDVQILKEKNPEIYKLLVIYLTYPRFDINVTKSMNHLLKVPFSVHHATQNVSQPINHQEIVNHYQLGNIIKFPHVIEQMQTRFQVEKPLKMYEDITECVKFFENFVKSVK
ncbi:DNA_primase small subunit [Hexamita inflata]|uniref:DNA primase n=1 Tax=Hexamita inflata TaxID=28002 RepID=A0AA86UU58_9EUKA|nr:DNA primase small subunit [Hexamita inflata]